jgi:hypothetical protein
MHGFFQKKLTLISPVTLRNGGVYAQVGKTLLISMEDTNPFSPHILGRFVLLTKH